MSSDKDKGDDLFVSPKLGRPPLEFDPEIGDLICRELIEGKSLRAIKRENPSLPSFHSIYNWLATVPEFAEQYRKSRYLQAFTFADMILDEAMSSSADISEGANGQSIVNGRVIYRSRLICDQLKWLAAKQAPKVYGEKQIIEHEGSPQSQINIAVDGPPRESREEWERRISSTLKLSE